MYDLPTERESVKQFKRNRDEREKIDITEVDNAHDFKYKESKFNIIDMLRKDIGNNILIQSTLANVPFLSE